MNIEGRIRILVHADAHGVDAVDVESSRPQLAQKLMAGRAPAEAAELAGMLFSLCGHAQRIAATVACAAAAGDGTEAARAHAVPILAEWIREHAWQLLINWPEAAGQAPDPNGLRALHRAGDDAGALAQATDALLAGQLLGEPPAQWLARDQDALHEWLAAGRYSARLFDVAHDSLGADACKTGLLPALQAMDDETVSELARQALSGNGFCARPTWHTCPVETGALARVQDHPLMAAWLTRHGRGADARLLARLIELAGMPARLRSEGTAMARAWTLQDGTGVAGVETSRGVLFHIARLDDDRVRDYRIVSPTEWNFHPQGALVELIRNLPVGPGLEARAWRLAHIFDPCISYGVEVVDA